jgi:tRNA(Ile)-lysidine synthase TilS/MesJ
MAAKIKYTIVPRDILEDAIYESGVALTENAMVIEPIIIFNSTMDLGIEQDIYNNEIPESNTRFSTEKDLYKILLEENEDEYCNTIIINGFNIDLNFVREKIAPLSKKSDKIFSINVLSDKRKFTNYTVYLNNTLLEDYSDDEWKEYITDFYKEFDVSLAQDKEEYSLSKEKYRAAEEKINDFLNKLLGIDQEQSSVPAKKEKKEELDEEIEVEISEERGRYLVDSSKDKPVIKAKSEEREHYESYTYEDNDGLVCISLDGDCLIIANEDDEILFDKKYIDQIIEFLSRL